MKIDGRWESSDVTRLPHFANLTIEKDFKKIAIL